MSDGIMNEERKRVYVTVDEIWLTKAKEALDAETNEDAVDRAIRRVLSQTAIEQLRAYGPLQFFEDAPSDLAEAKDEDRS